MNQEDRDKHLHRKFGNRKDSSKDKGIMTKSGKQTRRLNKTEQKELQSISKRAWIEVTIEYKTEAEGNRIAKAFEKLALDPSVELKLTFKKI